MAGAPYSASVAASGGIAPYTWSASGLPVGLTINSSSGQVTGTPTAQGSSSVALTATDSSTPLAQTASANLSLAVNPPTPVVSTPGVPSGPTVLSMNTPYTFTVGGSTSSLCSPVQYQFQWGDGSSSGWISGTAASGAWLQAGTYPVTVEAGCSNGSVTSLYSDALQVTVPYSIPFVFSEVSASQGDQVTVPIATSCANGFTGQIGIMSANLGGLLGNYNFTSWSVPCGTPTNLIINVYATAAVGPYNITVYTSAPYGELQVYNQTSLGLYVTTSQASRVSATPGQQTVTQGTSSASYQLSVTGINDYTGTFNFQCSGSSLCSSVTFAPPAVTGTGTSTMTVATGGAAPGTYGMTVRDNQQNVSTSVLLTVMSYGSPGFTLNTSQTPQAVVANGQSQSVPFTITATPQNGFNASIGLVCTGLPSGVSNGFTYNSISAFQQLLDRVVPHCRSKRRGGHCNVPGNRNRRIDH